MEAQPFILFVPGIKGSELFEGDNKRWFPKNLDDFNALNFNNTLEAKGLLSIVNAFGFYKAEIYKGMLDHYSPENFAFFAYDWRQSLIDIVDQLTRKIVNESQDHESIVLVAHSMGGILSKMAIHQLDSLGLHNKVSKFISVGTPWHGSPDAYKSLVFGEPGLFSKFSQVLQMFDDEKTRLLAAQLPSVYQLLPSKHYYNNLEQGKFLIGEDKDVTYEEMLLKAQSLFNKQYFDTYGISASVPNIWNDIMKPVQDIIQLPMPDYIDHDCLVGCEVPTIYKIPFTTDKKRLPFKKDCVFDNGDGVVPLMSGIPLHQANIYYCKGEHKNLTNLEYVLNFIDWSANGKNSELPQDISPEPLSNVFNRKVLAKVLCPVDSTVMDSQHKYIAGVFDTSLEDISHLANDDSIMYFNVGEAKYIFFNEEVDEDIIIKINSYDTGVADVSVKYFDGDEVTEQSFDPIPVSDEVAAIVRIPLSRENKDADLIVNEVKYEYKKRSYTKQINTAEGEAVPKLTIKVQGDERIKYRPLFSGSIVMKITADNNDLVENIYYSVDDGVPKKYIQAEELVLDSGIHKIKAFGKDIYNRSLLAKDYNFTIDNNNPKTKINININPEGIIVVFDSISLGGASKTFYRLGDQDFQEVPQGEELTVPTTELLNDINSFVKLDYYSENEFGKTEDIKSLKLSLGNIPILMWEETTSAITPDLIWGNIFKHDSIGLEEFNISFIDVKGSKVTTGTVVPDNVKGVSFKSELIEIEARYAEKYSLYFEGAPTEVLEVGQTCNFSFQLLTERSKEMITNTSPVVRLKAFRNRIPDILVRDLIEKDGIFYGQFVVDEIFKQHKFKLVITDVKNTNPALREIPLIMKEDEE
ncbi:hypothetical protein P40081_15450 [Paenibacillus sp. FSL P4-0081]|uniref:lipase/acyltransferase domain-containing protein n=1 Tax=Paenibacillus sp. FSL P4-0081 TaxID=1536769 RepID=UPI0004F6AB8F|nr:hypothetical protein [Paenibacillus sp. FSL P4-0081]AIQ29388.1 hypothetical protein P40081_15450 [Paenibacillus sp. FSL P4-0081]